MMKSTNTVLVVIYRNQSGNWDRISDGLMLLDPAPLAIVVAMDRPGNGDLVVVNEVTTKKGIYIDSISITQDVSVKMPNWDGKSDPFLAGYVRNKAIDHVTDRYKTATNIIFIDGDCVPQSNLIGAHEKYLNSAYPVLSVGRRREQEYGWKDRREADPTLHHIGLFSGAGFLVQNTELLKNSLVVWSCNVGMNLTTIKLIRKFNKKYLNRDEVFDSDFNGSWGGEDGFLGIIAWLCKIMITTISDVRSGVNHISHPRPGEKYSVKHKEFFDKKIEDIKKRMKVNPLSFEFFL